MNTSSLSIRAATTRRRGTCLAIVAALLCVVTACGSDDKPSSNKGSNSSGTTAPGTDHKLGESATVEYAVQAGEGEATITVTAFEAGQQGDLANFNLDQDEKTKTPWYIRYRVTNQGPVDARPAGFSTSLLAIDSEGHPLQKILLLGNFPRCDPTLTEGPFPTGTTKDTCDVVLVPPGKTMTEARYNPVTGPYAGAPITWTK